MSLEKYGLKHTIDVILRKKTHIAVIELDFDALFSQDTSTPWTSHVQQILFE